MLTICRADTSVQLFETLLCGFKFRVECEDTLEYVFKIGKTKSQGE